MGRYILRLWVDNDNHYMQKVSRIPATRMDVLSLQEKLDVRLEQQKAKETGIDPARRELYCQAFGMSVSHLQISYGSL